MDDIHINLDELKLDETIFKDVKYYISGQVPEKVLDVLRLCGAECSNYFTDYVTHLICGSEPDEDDITDASDVYEIPIVTPRWVLTCARLRKRISHTGFFYDPNQLFSGLVFCFSQLRGDDKHAVWSLCTYFGGVVHHNLTAHCTHLVTYDVKTSKYLKAFSLNDRIRIVTPDWVMESVKNKSLAAAEFFHPKLLLWPKPSESTALITGFADDTEKAVDIPETESTQALLDKLKQRMPWNQPNTPTNNTPANFPNFVNPTQEPAKRPQWTPPQSQPTTPQTTTNQSPFNSPEIKPRVQWTSGQAPNTQYSDTQISQTIKQEPDTNPTIQSQQKLQQPQQTQQQQLPTNQQQLPTNPQLSTNQQQLPTNQQQQLSTNQQQLPTNQQQLPTNQQVPANQQSQQIFQRIQRVQQFQNQQQTQQFNQLPQQNTQPQQIQNRAFMSPPTSQQPHLVTNQPQQYKLQNQQIGQPQVHHLPQTAGNQPKIGLITTQQQPNIQTGQLIQNRLNQFGNQQFPQQQQQNQQQFTPRVQVKQEKLPFNSQNMTQQYTVQNPQQQQNIVHQFMQTVQQRPQLHQNWQTQQLNQQQQPPQLNTQTINQQQLNQTQLNQQINQLQQGQINPQLNPQQIQQQINIQLNQTQQRIIQQQLNQQQINTQQINQQSLNNQQQLQQRLNQQIESQLNQQQQQPNQIQHQRLSQQLESQLNTQVNQAQLQQQRLTQQLESQLNSQQVTQQQQQQQRLSQQLEIPQQVNQTQILQQQQQHQQQQQQLELNPQQIRLNQQIEQQLNTPQLNQQQINQVQLNPQQQQQINQVQLNQQLQQPQQINQQQQIPQQQTIQLTPQQLQQRQLAQQQLNQTHLVQQQQLLQQQQQIQRPIGAPRLNWSPNQQPQRQLIHLDAQTHQQLQQMDPQQRALFVAKLQKQRQILLQQRQNHLLQQQQQQRGGQISVVRGGMPPGLTPQQQIQLLQQQQQQTITKQQTIVMPQHAGGAPGLSPILTDQQSHQQMQIQRQQFQRLQQLHLQREQAQKQQLQQQVPTVAIVRPPLPTQEAATVAVAVPGAVGEPVLPATPQQQLVVNAKTKTALANMLSIRLQSGGGNITPVEGEPSAAGTLRLMTAQHNAALNQTGARPQELLAIQQRRTLGNITNATGDLARAAPPTPVPTGAQPTEANKQQFSPGRVLAPPQHRHGPFYGHNPNLKLPPELFLLGCIFVVVEVERYLEETSPDWRTVIERHGGEIEPVYCSRVTHVLCETQRHGVVMQALRDFKRCVTLFWLDDVVKRKQVLPPWQALHLPTGYIDGAPASRHLISLSGFTGMERSKVRDMIKYTGAKFTSYFSRHNTVLVCAKAEGVKYQHAKKWNTPIVNVQWLTDLMLGNFAALGQIEHVKYQQFTQPVQFSFDTAIVPNLMFAWKMPINISQESYERVKRSPAPITMPPKAKKPRLDPQPMEVEENQGTELQPSQSHRVLFSMVNDTQKKTLAKIVTQLGGSLAKSYQDATHLVMPTLGRSIKLLYCIAAGIHIIPDKWLIDSQLENKFLDETNFQFDTKEFNKTYACDFYQTLAVQNRDKLFANKAFFITPSVVPDRVLLKELIELSGGVVEKQRRTLQQIEAANQTVPCSYIILTHSDDLHLVYDCLKNIKGNRLKCVSTCEFILSAILSQQLGIEKYLVKVELNG